MKGGFRYGTSSKKRSRLASKNKLYKSNTKKLLAGKLKKLKKMKKKNINFLKKLKRSNKLRLSKKYKPTRRMRKNRRTKSRRTKSRRTKRCRKVKRYRKSYKQGGGNNPLGFTYLQDITGEPLPARLPAGVHFNTSAGFGAELSNPPISGITPNTQCTNM